MVKAHGCAYDAGCYGPGLPGERGFMMTPPLPSEEASRLEALRQYRVLDTPPEQAYDDIARLAGYICGTPIALVSLVDEARQWFKARVGLSARETAREHAFCAHAILRRDLMVVEDASHDDRFADNPLVTGDPHIRFYAAAPLVNPAGHALGTLCVIDREPHHLSASQEEALQALARVVMQQLELKRVSAELAQALSRVRTLSGLLPICSYCKGIRNDEGYWERVEAYLQAHTSAGFTHSICPDCAREHFPDCLER